ncbi:hypothetical protein [Candidatus Ichthyocystis hellenicum]|uniref:hypothetical protein n=1 Tax=Candidatus Ichthyocystis hellenicum TaxID=1561003 RepID=UPI000B804B54|nr:hypothetical protein [Candidatus Ichthyocystis hellenicum]
MEESKTVLLDAYKLTYQIDTRLAQQRNLLFPPLSDSEYLSEFFDHILSADWNRGNTTLRQMKQQQRICKEIFDTHKNLKSFAPEWSKIDEELEEQAKRTTFSSRTCNEELAQLIKNSCIDGISTLRNCRKMAAQDALYIRHNLLLMIDHLHNKPEALAKIFLKITQYLASKNNNISTKELKNLLSQYSYLETKNTVQTVHTADMLLLPQANTLQNITSQQKKKEETLKKLASTLNRKELRTKQQSLNKTRGFANACKAVASIVRALEIQCTTQGLKITTNFDDQEIRCELGSDLEELHTCKQEAMDDKLSWTSREAAWWNWGRTLLNMLLETLPLDDPIRGGLLEDAIDAGKNGTTKGYPLEKLAIIVKQVLKLQHDTSSHVCEVGLSEIITNLGGTLNHTKKALGKNTAPSWSERFGQSFLGRTTLHYLHSLSAVTDVLSTSARARGGRKELGDYRTYFHSNLDNLQAMMPPTLANKIEIKVKQPDWDQAKKEIQQFIDWNTSLDQKLAKEAKEVTTAVAIPYKLLTEEDKKIEILYRKQETNGKNRLFSSFASGEISTPHTEIRQYLEISMSKEFDYWASTRHEETMGQRLKRSLDTPVSSPATSVSEFTNLVKGNFELTTQSSFDDYLSAIQQDGFSSADAQSGFKALLTAISAVDRVNSLGNTNLANQGHVLKLRIVASTYLGNPVYTKSYETTEPSSFEEAVKLLKSLGISEENLGLITNDKALLNAGIALKISNEGLISKLGETHAITSRYEIDVSIIDAHTRLSKRLLTSPTLQARFDATLSSWSNSLSAEELAQVMGNPDIKKPLKFSQDILIEAALVDTAEDGSISHGLVLCVADAVRRNGLEGAAKLISEIDVMIRREITSGQLEKITQLKASLHRLNNLALSPGETITYEPPHFLSKADYRTPMSAAEVYSTVMHPQVEEGTAFFVGLSGQEAVLVKGFSDAPNLMGRTPLLTFFSADTGMFPLLNRKQAISFLQGTFDSHCGMDAPATITPGTGRAVIATYNPSFSDQVIPVLGDSPVRETISAVNNLIKASATQRSPLESLMAAVAETVDPITARVLLQARAQASLPSTSHSHVLPLPEDTATSNRNLLALKAATTELYNQINTELTKTGINEEDVLLDIRNLFNSVNEDSSDDITIKVWSATDAAEVVTSPPGTETHHAQLDHFFRANAERFRATVGIKVRFLHKVWKMVNLMYPPTIIDTVVTKSTGLLFDILNIVNLCEMYKALESIHKAPEDQRAVFMISYTSSVINMVSASAQWSALITEKVSALASSSIDVAAQVSANTGNVIAAASVGASAGSMVAGIVNSGFAIKSMAEAKTAYQFNTATLTLVTSLASVGLGTVGLLFPGFGAIIAGISLLIVALKLAIAKYYRQATVGFYKAMKGFCQTDMEFKAILELLMSDWIRSNDKVISFDKSIPIDSVEVSKYMITATKTNNSFQLRPMYEPSIGLHSDLSPQERARIRFSFDKMLSKRPFSIKKIYPKANLQRIVQNMNKKSLRITNSNSSAPKILMLPQGKAVTLHPDYEIFSLGFGAPYKSVVASKFKYIDSVTKSSENSEIVNNGKEIRKYLPLLPYYSGFGGTVAISYDRGYYDQDSNHKTTITLGPEAPTLMIPPALDFIANQIGITGVMRNSWNRDALTRDYVTELKPNATAAIIVNPNAYIKFGSVPSSSTIGFTEWYPGQIEEVIVTSESTSRYQLVLKMKPTPIQKSNKEDELQKESPFDQWKKHLPECNLEDPDPQDYEKTDHFDPLAGRVKTTTKFSIPREKNVILNLAEGIDSESKKPYHGLTSTISNSGIRVEFIGNPRPWFGETKPHRIVPPWTVGQAKEIIAEVGRSLRRNPKVVHEFQSPPEPTPITWKSVTPVYDLTCRGNPAADTGLGWLVSPKNLTNNDQVQDDVYPELKNDHAIPICLSQEVKVKYGNSSNDWSETELIWIQEIQSNDRVEHRDEKWPDFGNYYFFNKKNSLLLKQVDDNPVQLNQVSMSHLHPKQLIDIITGRYQIVPGETEFSPQGIDGGFGGNLFIATEEVATNATFMNKTLEFQKGSPLSTILVPNIQPSSDNITSNMTIIKTPQETFTVPTAEGKDSSLIGTLVYNNTQVAVIKSSAPIRNKRDLQTDKHQTIKLHLVDPSSDTETEELPQLQELFKEEEILDADVNSLLNTLTVRLSPGILVGINMSPKSIGDEWQQRMQLLGVGKEIWQDLQKNEDPESYMKQKLEGLSFKYGTPQQRFFPIPTPGTNGSQEGSVSPMMWYDTVNFQMFTIDWSLVKVSSPIGEVALDKIPHVYQLIGYSQKERQLLYATALVKDTPLDYLASVPLGSNKEGGNQALTFLSLQDMGNDRFLGKLWQSEEGKVQYTTPPLPGITHLMLLPQNKREDNTSAVELVVPEEAMVYLKSITLVVEPVSVEETEIFPSLKFNPAGYDKFMEVSVGPVILRVDGADLIVEILKPRRNHSNLQESPEYFIIRFEKAFDESWSLHPRCGNVVTVGAKTYSWKDLRSMLPNAKNPDFERNQGRDPKMEEL